MVCLQVAAATDFLVRVHPLRHVAPVRKSQVQHALCEMLAAILADASRRDLPWCAPCMLNALKSFISVRS